MGSGSSKPTVNGSNILGSNEANINDFPVSTYHSIETSAKKYAVIIGCNYLGESFALRGCINDANDVENFISNWGFEISLMTDYSQGNLYPTKANIINNLTTYIGKLNSGDTLLIYYSGHGALVRDTNDNEISGSDSVIVPLDVSRQGYILDDILRSLLVQAPSGSNILACFDSCNSGSVCDLRYCLYDSSYREFPGIKNSNIIPRQTVITNNQYPDTNANIISLSGCHDEELSYEVVKNNGRYGGALTYCFLSSLSSTPIITFGSLLANVKSRIGSLNLSQNPSLMSGTTFDENVKVSDFLHI